MNSTRNNKRLHRANRVRSKISGTPERPRLSVFRSLTTMTVQVIDDTNDKTIVSAKLAEIKGAKNSVEGAKKLGELIAQKANEKKITEVVFDRAGYKYHGKVKALADAARQSGLKF
ncbi:MAG: 50S ribosomal protein L18 [Candidatus Moraniibacteriota bacterium]|nr:MAG: 50S ribosomal protein L18 [Candidatus Moranbacteria bacterium]